MSERFITIQEIKKIITYNRIWYYGGLGVSLLCAIIGFVSGNREFDFLLLVFFVFAMHYDTQERILSLRLENKLSRGEINQREN